MRISVLTVGKCDPLLLKALEHYEMSAKHYWKIQVWEISSGVLRSKKTFPEEVKKQEAERIMTKIPARSEVIALSRVGKKISSTGLSEYLQECALRSISDVTFVIGGAFGLSEIVLNRADRVMALSDFTYTHGLARLHLLEQIYRAGTIMRNEPYHKGGV